MKDTLYLMRDMLGAIKAIESYMLASFEDFQADGKRQDTVMYNLIILGEAAAQIPDEFQAQHPQIPWSAIIGTRHVIVHGYDQVKLQIVWDILQNDLESLKSNLTKLF